LLNILHFILVAKGFPKYSKSGVGRDWSKGCSIMELCYCGNHILLSGKIVELNQHLSDVTVLPRNGLILNPWTSHVVLSNKNLTFT